MHLEGLQDVLAIVTYGLAILVLSIVADQKNRNPLAWGLVVSAGGQNQPGMGR